MKNPQPCLSPPDARGLQLILKNPPRNADGTLQHFWVVAVAERPLPLAIAQELRCPKRFPTLIVLAALGYVLYPPFERCAVIPFLGDGLNPKPSSGAQERVDEVFKGSGLNHGCTVVIRHGISRLEDSLGGTVRHHEDGLWSYRTASGERHFWDQDAHVLPPGFCNRFLLPKQETVLFA